MRIGRFFRRENKLCSEVSSHLMYPKETAIIKGSLRRPTIFKDKNFEIYEKSFEELSAYRKRMAIKAGKRIFYLF